MLRFYKTLNQLKDYEKTVRYTGNNTDDKLTELVKHILILITLNSKETNPYF